MAGQTDINTLWANLYARWQQQQPTATTNEEASRQSAIEQRREASQLSAEVQREAIQQRAASTEANRLQNEAELAERVRQFDESLQQKQLASEIAQWNELGDTLLAMGKPLPAPQIRTAAPRVGATQVGPLATGTLFAPKQGQAPGGGPAGLGKILMGGGR